MTFKFGDEATFADLPIGTEFKRREAWAWGNHTYLKVSDVQARRAYTNKSKNCHPQAGQLCLVMEPVRPSGPAPRTTPIPFTLRRGLTPVQIPEPFYQRLSTHEGKWQCMEFSEVPLHGIFHFVTEGRKVIAGKQRTKISKDSCRDYLGNTYRLELNQQVAVRRNRE